MAPEKKKRGRPPARPDDHVPGNRSGVTVFLRMGGRLKTALEEARKEYNRTNDLDLNFQQFVIKLLKGQLRTMGKWDEGDAD